MKLKKFISTMAPAVALALAGFAVQAAEINSLFGAGINTIQDTDAERIMRDTDGDGVVDTAVTSGDLQIGDVFETVLRFDTANGVNINQGLSSLAYNLVAYSQVQVTNIVDNGDGTSNLTFGATGNLSSANSLLDLYEDVDGGLATWDLGLAPATLISNIQSETFVASFGFGEAFDFFTGTGPTDVAILSNALTGSGQAGQAVFGLSVLANPGGLPIGDLGINSQVSGLNHDLVGSNSVYARETNVNTGWLLSSNLEASFFTVPAPGALALFGLGFTLMSARIRRAKRTA